MKKISITRNIYSPLKTLLLFVLVFSCLSIGPDSPIMSQALAQGVSSRIQQPREAANSQQGAVKKQLDDADLEDIEKYEFSLNAPVSLIISIPARKPNDQYWDGLPQWAMGGLVQSGQAVGFFHYDSPPDIKLFAVPPAGEVINLGIARNRFEAEFMTSNLPETFALVAIDLDGLGFHDFIGAAIFCRDKKNVDESVRQVITKRIIDQLNYEGVQQIAYPLEFDAAGQVPNRFRVINIRDCVAKPCRLSRTDGVVIQFSNEID